MTRDERLADIEKIVEEADDLARDSEHTDAIQRLSCAVLELADLIREREIREAEARRELRYFHDNTPGGRDPCDPQVTRVLELLAGDE